MLDVIVQVSSQSPDVSIQKTDRIMSHQPQSSATGIAQMASAARTKKRASGQTLVEISVMVAVLMVLAGALLPVVADSVQSTRVSRARHEAARIAADLLNAQRDHGRPLAALSAEVGVPHVIDPWGHEYLVNLPVVSALEQHQDAQDRFAVFVISAGPNGLIDTPMAQLRDGARAWGDDVLVRVR